MRRAGGIPLWWWVVAFVLGVLALAEYLRWKLGRAPVFGPGAL
jgi:hypothetical protein